MKIGRNSKCICGSGKKFKKCCLYMVKGARTKQYKNVCVVIGNGLTIDFIKNIANIDILNSSLPLSNFSNNNITYDNFIDKIPSIRDELLLEQHQDHFEAIKKFININYNDVKKDCELRRFLAISYSLFYLELQKHFDNFKSWKWYKWFNYNSEKISLGISFNYDLLFEDIFKHINKPIRRIGCKNEISGLPIIKPHGSIDFEISDGFIGGTFNAWDIHTCLNDCNGYIKSIPSTKWTEPRLEADIIPPTQQNYQYKLGWVEKGDKLFTQKANNIDAIVIIGFSYSNADQKEFNKYILRLPKNKKIDIYNVGPSPSLELKGFVELQGHKLIEIREGTPW